MSLVPSSVSRGRVRFDTGLGLCQRNRMRAMPGHRAGDRQLRRPHFLSIPDETRESYDRPDGH